MADAPEAVDPFVLHRLAEAALEQASGRQPARSDATGAGPELLDAIAAAVDAAGAELVELSHDLHAHPEEAFAEHRSAGVLGEAAERRGIAVSRGAYGLDTALRAEIGGDGPTIAIMSEYDALPGIGHGCGHNVIATAGLGAFLGLAAVAERLPGRVVWLGTPAEEGGSGKELMARSGALDDIDAAIMVHPYGYDLADQVFLGRRQLRATFTGIASHASAQPFMGRNALDAVNLAYTGVGLHRQQLPPTDRIHGVITHGGDRPNVIPERAELLFYLRSEYPESLKILSARLSDIVQGAALMAGCTVELTWDEAPPYLPIRANQILAAAWNRRYGDLDHQMMPSGSVPSTLAGSTDFGNVSYRVPGVHPMIKIADHDASLHTHEFAAAAISETADRVVVDAAKGLAFIAADYLVDADFRRAVNDEFAAAGGPLDVERYFD